METLEFIRELIATIGFPAACCIYMMVTNNKTVEKNTEATNKMIMLLEQFLTKIDADKDVLDK